MLTSFTTRLYDRSVRLVGFLQANLSAVVVAWCVVGVAASTARLVFPATPISDGYDAGRAFASYLIAIIAPVAALWLGLRLHRPGIVAAQPSIRLAFVGRWRSVDPVTARSTSGYGTFGIMASLLLGILLNVPVRTLEFIAAVPALGSYPPSWFIGLHTIMLLDVTVMSALYAFAFAMALRAEPLFPRFLVAVWGTDLVAQFVIAHVVADLPGTPATVQAALSGLLHGNVTKVLISIALWLPYLLLSRRVNLTYRHRIRAA